MGSGDLRPPASAADDAQPAEAQRAPLPDAAVYETAKVLDFGIAKVKEARLGAGVTLTGTGVVIGTPQYMSPEQAMGKRGDELDGRSDLYSLGIVAYQMLTRQLAFKADTTLELLLAHMQQPPTPIRVLRLDLEIPEPVANVVMRCLEKKRELRPASAQALIEDLDRAEIVGAGLALPKGAASSAPTLGDMVRAFKSESATAVNRLLNRAGKPLWQRNYYEHIVRNDDELNKIREYIMTNPLRWASDQENPAALNDDTGDEPWNV